MAALRRLTRSPCLVIGVVLSSACDAPRVEPRPVALDMVRTPSGSWLRLTPGPCVKINARLAPALELASGGRITFDAGRLTPDRAYFAEPPRAEVSGAETRVAGTLRVSVCRDAARVCQTVVLMIDQAIPTS